MWGLDGPIPYVDNIDTHWQTISENRKKNIFNASFKIKYLKRKITEHSHFDIIFAWTLLSNYLKKITSKWPIKCIVYTCTYVH